MSFTSCACDSQGAGEINAIEPLTPAMLSSQHNHVEGAGVHVTDQAIRLSVDLLSNAYVGTAAVGSLVSPSTFEFAMDPDRCIV